MLEKDDKLSAVAIQFGMHPLMVPCWTCLIGKVVADFIEVVPHIIESVLGLVREVGDGVVNRGEHPILISTCRRYYEYWPMRVRAQYFLLSTNEKTAFKYFHQLQASIGSVVSE